MSLLPALVPKIENKHYCVGVDVATFGKDESFTFCVSIHEKGKITIVQCDTVRYPRPTLQDSPVDKLCDQLTNHFDGTIFTEK